MELNSEFGQKRNNQFNKAKTSKSVLCDQTEPFGPCVMTVCLVLKIEGCEFELDRAGAFYYFLIELDKKAPYKPRLKAGTNCQGKVTNLLARASAMFVILKVDLDGTTCKFCGTRFTSCKNHTTLKTVVAKNCPFGLEHVSKS